MAHHVKSDHTEIVSKDPAATQKFMEKAFGLKFTVTGPEMGNYRIHGRNEQASAGSVGIRAQMDPKDALGAIPYFTVPNLDEAIKSVKGAGAHILMDKTAIPGMGHFAVYVAPGEVRQGIFQANPP